MKPIKLKKDDWVLIDGQSSTHAWDRFVQVADVDEANNRVWFGDVTLKYEVGRAIFQERVWFDLTTRESLEPSAPGRILRKATKKERAAEESDMLRQLLIRKAGLIPDKAVKKLLKIIEREELSLRKKVS